MLLVVLAGGCPVPEVAVTNGWRYGGRHDGS